MHCGFLEGGKIMSYLTKTLIAVAIVFALVIFLGIFIDKNLSSSAAKLDEFVSNVEQYTADNNWTQAKNELVRVMKYWDKLKNNWTIMAHHADIDRITVSINRIKKLIDLEETSLALSELAVLKELIRNVPEKEKLTLSNIL